MGELVYVRSLKLTDVKDRHQPDQLPSVHASQEGTKRDL